MIDEALFIQNVQYDFPDPDSPDCEMPLSWLEETQKREKHLSGPATAICILDSQPMLRRQTIW